MAPHPLGHHTSHHTPQPLPAAPHKTHSGALLHAATYWLLGLPAGLLLGFRAGMGAKGLWLGVAAATALQAVALHIWVAARFDWAREVARSEATVGALLGSSHALAGLEEELLDDDDDGDGDADEEAGAGAGSVVAAAARSLSFVSAASPSAPPSLASPSVVLSPSVDGRDGGDRDGGGGSPTSSLRQPLLSSGGSGRKKR